MADIRRAAIRTLETKRLRLLPLALADAPRIQQLLPDPDVLRYMHARSGPFPSDGAETFVRRSLPLIEMGEEYYWSLRLKAREDDGLIGVIGLTPHFEEEHRAFWIGKAFWGQGYMREAAAAVCDFAFDDVRMPELLLNNAEPNVASHRLKASCGAEIVDIRDREYIGGTFPEVRWRLSSEAWRRYRQGSGT